MGSSNRIITLKEFYRLSERRMRISVDIDVKKGDRLRPLKTFFNLKHLFPNCDVTMQRTRHGFQVKAVGKTIEKIPHSRRVDIREMLGDDPLRVEFDRRKLKQGRYYLTDTLFSMKRGFDRKLHVVEEVNPVALPYVSHLPQKKTD